MRFIDALGTDAQKRRYFAEVVDRGKLFGSWGSEPAVSLSRTFLMETACARDGDALGRRRREALLHDGARARRTTWSGARSTAAADMGKALLPGDRARRHAGIATDGKWDTLGMRGTYSPSVTLTGVRVPADAALGRPGGALRRRRRRGLRARLRGGLHRHRRGRARLRRRLRRASAS